MNRPNWLQERTWEKVTVKKICRFYGVSDGKVRRLIQKFGFTDSITSTQYMYVFDNELEKDRLEKIHEALTGGK